MTTKDSKAPEAQATHYGIGALCEATGASAKDVRRWLRTAAKAHGAGDTLPGKGGRYAFTPETVAVLARAYAQAKARKGTAATGEALAKALSEPDAS